MKRYLCRHRSKTHPCSLPSALKSNTQKAIVIFTRRIAGRGYETTRASWRGAHLQELSRNGPQDVHRKTSVVVLLEVVVQGASKALEDETAVALSKRKKLVVCCVACVRVDMGGIKRCENTHRIASRCTWKKAHMLKKRRNQSRRVASLLRIVRLSGLLCFFPLDLLCVASDLPRPELPYNHELRSGHEHP